MNTAIHSAVPIGESLDPVSSSQDEQDACVFCDHLLTSHEPESSFDGMNDEGHFTGYRKKGRYCWQCLKMCWR